MVKYKDYFSFFLFFSIKQKTKKTDYLNEYIALRYAAKTNLDIKMPCNAKLYFKIDITICSLKYVSCADGAYYVKYKYNGKTYKTDRNMVSRTLVTWNAINSFFITLNKDKFGILKNHILKLHVKRESNLKTYRIGCVCLDLSRFILNDEMTEYNIIYNDNKKIKLDNSVLKTKYTISQLLDKNNDQIYKTNYVGIDSNILRLADDIFVGGLLDSIYPLQSDRELVDRIVSDVINQCDQHY
jgi:hypothetical protein